MPYRFKFTAPGEFSYECTLQCGRCTAITKTGAQCSKIACIGVPYCHVHLYYQKHLKIKPSAIPGAGKGLFAAKPGGGNDIVFRTGDLIIEYGGEAIDTATLDHRYGDYTAPYGLKRQSNQYEDAACRRGVGSLANHKPGSQANAKYSAGRNPARLNLLATKNIRNGQEVCCSYFGARRGQAEEYGFDEGTTSTTRAVSRRASQQPSVRRNLA